jgi:hypothetical protein
MTTNVHMDTSPNRPVNSRILRFFAQLFSYVFHPLFIASFTIAFLLFIHPSLFVGFDHKTKVKRFITVLYSTTLLPIFAVFLMVRLKLFITSFQLRTARDRMVPYVIAMTFYFWAWWVYANLPDIPAPAIHFLLGAFLAVCGGWFCNIFFKISMHTIAVGGLLMFFLLFSFRDSYASGLYLSLVTLIAGLVCTARLIASNHSHFDIYAGVVVGMLSQYIAWQF